MKYIKVNILFTIFLVVIVATCHCRTIPNFKIFLNEHFLFVIVALKIFSIKILYILNYLQYLSIELIFLSLSHFLVVIVAKRKIWNIWCDNDNEKYGNFSLLYNLIIINNKLMIITINKIQKLIQISLKKQNFT